VDRVRRLLSLAAVLDGKSRKAAAGIGAMDRQTLRDWAHRFNEKGPEGLVEPLPRKAMRTLLERMTHSKITVHGFRSTFRDSAADCTNFSSEVVEMALAHAIRDSTEAAYRRSDLFEKRLLLNGGVEPFCDGYTADGC
jgi:integrase